MIQFDDVIDYVKAPDREFIFNIDINIASANPYPNLLVDLDPEMPFKHEICLRCSTSHFNLFIGPLSVQTTCSQVPITTPANFQKHQKYDASNK